jgi:hypothetical protein
LVKRRLRENFVHGAFKAPSPRPRGRHSQETHAR